MTDQMTEAELFQQYADGHIKHVTLIIIFCVDFAVFATMSRSEIGYDFQTT